MKHYIGAFVFAIAAVVIGFVLGGPAMALQVALLSVIEVSLSFDNAVVNATVLKNWPAYWQKLFIVVGVPIAVFGMRFAMPIGIVAMILHASPLSVLHLAIHAPQQYAAALTSAHDNVAAFGGVFLLLIALNFFLDSEKDSHWLSWIEAPLTRLGQFEAIQVGLALSAVALAGMFVPSAGRASFMLSGVAGVITYVAVEAIGALLGGEGEGDEESTTAKVIKAGIGGLLYLEILDASMSFDGVIGAFAVSRNIFAIMLGLGTGAMFVRSMTLHLVQSGKLAELRYIEHGAFWAILGLAALLLASVHVDVPDVFTALFGITVLAAAYGNSLWANKREQGLELDVVVTHQEA
jgi:hypothetical protein